MATKRPSVQKREREQKKRDRKIMKAAKAAERKAASAAEPDPSQTEDIGPEAGAEPRQG